jgi:hypothetical protein
MSNVAFTNPKTKRNGKMIFLSVLPEIKAEMAEGYTLTAIHANRASSLGISYSQFTRYVNCFITSETKSSNKSNLTTTVAPHIVHRQPVRAPG